jgi:ADP-ribosylglycohydrolase
MESLRAAAVSPPVEFTASKSGWVLVAFQNAFFRLLHAASLEKGIVDTVRCGGDTDTNAAIAGALLGAVHGCHTIPQRWIGRILACRPIQGPSDVHRPRPAEYWPVDALPLAENLLLVGRSAV